MSKEFLRFSFMLCFVSAALMTLLFSFASAELGLFSRSAAACVFVVCLAALWISDRKWHFMPRVGGVVGGMDLLILFAAILAAGLLYFPPSEYVLGGWDPGVYVASGAAIQRHGGINFNDPLLASLDRAERNLFSARRYGLVELYPAWRVMDPPDGNVLGPQFYHMYPVLLALTSAIGGVWGALCTNPFIALLCILALYALCRKVAGPRIAILGPLLYVICPVQTWLARFQNSEMLGQLCFLAGFGFLFLATGMLSSDATANRRRAGTAAYVLSALCFGVAQLTRPELLMASILILSMGILSLGWKETPADIRRGRAVWVGCMLIMLIHALVYQRFVAVLYTPLGINLYLAALFLPVMAAVGAVILSLFRGRVEGLWARVSGPARWLAVAGLVLAVLYVSLIRIRDESLGLERFTFYDIAELVSWPVMALAIIGCIAMVVGSRSFEGYALLAAGLLALAGAIHNRLIDPFYLWAARRFASFVLPFLFLAACVGAGLLVKAGAQAMEQWGLRRVGRHLPGLVVAALVCGVATLSARDLDAVAGCREFVGLTDFLRQTAEAFPRADLVIAEPGPDDDLRGIAESLHFFHGIPVVCLKNLDAANVAALEVAVARRLKRGQTVYVLSAGERAFREWTKVRLEKKDVFRWEGAILSHESRPFPHDKMRRAMGLTLFETSMGE